MTTFRSIEISPLPPNPGAVACYDSYLRRVRVGPDFLYPFSLADLSAGAFAAETLFHEIGHAFEDEYDLMETTFTAPLGTFDPVRMAFVVPRMALRPWSATESVYKNPSEAVASLFTDYVAAPARLTEEQRRWFEARMVEKPEWARAVAALREADVPAMVGAGIFDPDRV